MAYSKEDIKQKFDFICNEILEGKALRTILKGENMPAPAIFYKWLDEDELKVKQYARACNYRAESIFDEILEIADNTSNDTITTERGDIPNSEWIARSRLRVDSRKWIASKLNPKKYGDKTDVTSGGDKIQNIPTSIQVEINRANED